MLTKPKDTLAIRDCPHIGADLVDFLEKVFALKAHGPDVPDKQVQQDFGKYKVVEYLRKAHTLQTKGAINV